jgi:hypothetical protein
MTKITKSLVMQLARAISSLSAPRNLTYPADNTKCSSSGNRWSISQPLEEEGTSPSKLGTQWTFGREHKLFILGK